MKRLRSDSGNDEALSALRAGIAALSVSSLTLPKDLICRDKHIRAIIDFLEDPTSLTMQVFGMPGTGKTASIRYALTQLSHTKAQKLTAVMLNGFIVQKSIDIYWTLYQHLSRTRLNVDEVAIAPERCAASIEKRFRHGWGRSVSLCVIVIDEVDKILERHAKSFFRVIDWLSLPHSYCKLITVSNSMELAIDAKTRSRLDVTKQLVFFPYGINELKTIFLHRISTITPKLFTDQAVNLLCHQTASQYGDVRRLLQASSAAICSVLMSMEDGTFTYNASDGIVSVKSVHNVVRQVFHDRFIEFIKTIRTPMLFIIVYTLAKETERLYNQHSSDLRLSIEHILSLVHNRQSQFVTTKKLLTRAAFLDNIDLLRQVSLIDLSIGDTRIPLHSVEAMLASSEDVYASLLQPFQTIVDTCRLHDVFASSIASKIV